MKIPSELRRTISNIEEVSLSISELEYNCYIWKVRGRQEVAGLIAFRGIYKLGSAGTKDAKFINWRINEFAELPTPSTISGLIVDFRELDYRWGDDLAVNPIPIRRRGGPVRVVIQPEDVEAERYKAFIWALGNAEICTDLNSAYEQIENLIPQNKW